MLKKLILFLSLIICLSTMNAVLASATARLDTFNDVFLVLQKGNHIQSISDFNQCIPSANDNIIFGTMEFNHAVAYTQIKNGKAEKVISMNNTFETVDESKYAKKYIKLNLYEDNNVEFLIQELNSLSSPISTNIYHCHLNKGVSLYFMP